MASQVKYGFLVGPGGASFLLFILWIFLPLHLEEQVLLPVLGLDVGQDGVGGAVAGHLLHLLVVAPALVCRALVIELFGELFKNFCTSSNGLTSQ